VHWHSSIVLECARGVQDHYHQSVNATTCSCLHTFPLDSVRVFCCWVQC